MPGQAQAEAQARDRVIPGPGLRMNQHLESGSLKMTGYRIVDAITEEVLHRAVYTEARAEELLKKVQRKHPAAFVDKVSAS